MTTFDRAALEALPIAPGSTGAIRERAFAQFQVLPVPSQETEEWRYTDLSDFALDFVPHAPGHGEGAPAPAGAGLAASILQHNSSVVMTTSGQDLDARGVIFCDLDVAPLVPARRGRAERDGADQAPLHEQGHPQTGRRTRLVDERVTSEDRGVQRDGHRSAWISRDGYEPPRTARAEDVDRAAVAHVRHGQARDGVQRRLDLQRRQQARRVREEQRAA